MVNEQLADAYELEGYANREISQKEIIKMMDMHGCSWKRNPDASALYVAEDNNSEYDDTSGWQLFDVLSFLNY